jgi:hypothetical protein
MKFAIQPNLTTQARADIFVQQVKSDNMGPEEKDVVKAWMKKQGCEERGLENGRVDTKECREDVGGVPEHSGRRE